MSVKLSPSIISADFARLGEEVARVEAGGADFIHVDVMDGHFVPNITIGLPVIAALKRIATVPLDVHVMIDAPDRYIDAFVKAGADLLTIHLEATTHLHRAIVRIRELGARAGVALNPSTPVSSLRDIATDLDQVLVMSVNPGFSGQSFIPHAFRKVAETRALLAEAGSQAAIEVDGGVDITNARELVAAGASILVAGAAVFNGRDATAATRALRAAAVGAR